MVLGVHHSNFPLLSAVKQFIDYSEKVCLYFLNNVTEQFYVNEKMFALGIQILFP